MTDSVTNPETQEVETLQSSSKSSWQLVWRRFRRHRPATVSMFVLLAMVVVCVCAPWIAPHDPTDVESSLIFAPANAADQYYLGNDYLGRDILSRLIYGGRVSLLIGFVVALINAFTGSVLGAIAGYFSGRSLTLSHGLWRSDVWHLPKNTLIAATALIALAVVAVHFIPLGFFAYTGVILALWLLSSLVMWQVIKMRSVRAFGWAFFAVILPWILVGFVKFGHLFSDGLGLTGSVITWVVLAVLAALLIIFGLFRRLPLSPDLLISRGIDFALAIPIFPFLLILSALLNDKNIPLGGWVDKAFGDATSIVLIIIVLSLLGWFTNARLIRGEVLKLRSQDFTDAARALGAGNNRIMFRHLLPNALAPLIVNMTLDIGSVILVEAGLSFLGFGVQEPAASWGNMLTGVQNYVVQYPLKAVWPGLMIVITVLSFNYIGDGLRDALDPRSRL